MNTTEQRAEARSRANRRLRNMTIGTAILAVAATGSLGWAAAITYNGASTQADLTAAVVTTTVGDTTATDATSTTSSTRRPRARRPRLLRPPSCRAHLAAPTYPRVAPDVIEQADWRALGTGVRLLVLDGDLSAARAAVERVLDDVDRTFSRFRSDSELMSIRASAGRATKVSPLLARAIAGAMDAARRSNGAVDPTVGRAMRVIGYDLDFDLIAGSARPLELRIAPVPGWSAISFDSAIPRAPGPSWRGARPRVNGQGARC